MKALYYAIVAVAVTLLNLYWDILKGRLAAIWAAKDGNFWWNVRCSLIATCSAAGDMVLAVYKKGLFDAIISIIIKLIKGKLGIPAMVKAIKK